MKKSITFWLFIGLLPLFLQGQEDSILVYNSGVVTVYPKFREDAFTGSGQFWNAEKLGKTNAGNIAELLEQESNVFIKSYGLNSLATSSIRGGSAGQTLVLWNGFPVQSPTLGLLDLSLLPIQSADKVSLQKGGNSALWGSGAVGGVIALKNKKTSYLRGSEFSIGTKIGSFGEWLQDGTFRFGNAKFQSSTKFSHHQAKNDFSFSVSPGFPSQEQKNASFSIQNFFQDFYYNINSKHQIATHFWYQKSDREIPPLTTQNFSQAHQDDESIRLVIDWKVVEQYSILNGKFGFFNEKMRFFDDLIGLDAPSNFSTLFAEFDGQWVSPKGHTLISGLTHSYTTALTDGYDNSEEEFRTALFASYYYQNIKLFRFQASLRQGLINTTRVPLVPVIAVSFPIKNGPYLSFKVSKNYRLPTLNDRYWKPGGNEDLLAESGWSEEISISYQWYRKYPVLDISLTAFNKNIDNWILWSLLEGQPFWSANNISKVWSRGLEPRISFYQEIKKSKIKFTLGYDYIRSTNQVALQFPRIAKGEQLLYTPIHQAFGKLDFDYKKFHFAYRHQFTGKSQGVNEAIDDYQTGSLRLQYDAGYKNYNGKFFLNINNLWDADYFVIERRPMPGRYWQVGVKLGIDCLRQ